MLLRPFTRTHTCMCVLAQIIHVYTILGVRTGSAAAVGSTCPGWWLQETEETHKCSLYGSTVPAECK